MTTPANKRITIRTTHYVQERLQLAADLIGLPVSQFIAQAALEKAEKVIADETTLTPSRRDWETILDLLDNPPPLNQHFLDAEAHYRETVKNALPFPDKWK